MLMVRKAASSKKNQLSAVNISSLNFDCSLYKSKDNISQSKICQTPKTNAQPFCFRRYQDRQKV